MQCGTTKRARMHVQPNARAHARGRRCDGAKLACAEGGADGPPALAFRQPLPCDVRQSLLLRSGMRQQPTHPVQMCRGCRVLVQLLEG
jgi:hypothetical protein